MRWLDSRLILAATTSVLLLSGCQGGAEPERSEQPTEEAPMPDGPTYRSLRHLVNAADVVIVGVVGEPREDDDETAVYVRVAESLKGRVKAGEEITVLQPGTREQPAAGVHRLDRATGREFVMFLRRSGPAGFTELDPDQSVLRLRNGRLAPLPDADPGFAMVDLERLRQIVRLPGRPRG